MAPLFIGWDRDLVTVRSHRPIATVGQLLIEIDTIG